MRNKYYEVLENNKYITMPQIMSASYENKLRKLTNTSADCDFKNIFFICYMMFEVCT